jgi:membrane-bound lytic murein transglycosylase D
MSLVRPLLALTLAVAASAGCRSAGPEVAPGPPATSPAASPSAAPQTQAAPSVPTEAPLPSPVPSPSEVSDAEPGFEEANGEPRSLQREALALCESAEASLDEGRTDYALAAIDKAYGLLLALPDEGEDLQAKEEIRLLISSLLHRAYRPARAASASSRKWDLALPLVDNDHVRREVQSFMGPEREEFLAAYRRSGRYRPMILARLEAAGLPSQLAWLPMVESWFKVRALSRASALGLWQFISSTGLRFGLSRDAWVDERLDPEKSTDAAVAYLTELHDLFGDWPKALAGYNCGEGRVLRLQRRASGDYLDFWDLYELLPRETRRYVPRLFAAIQILESPERHGFRLPEPDPVAAPVASVVVERPVELEKLDAALGLGAGSLAELNPELRYRATPERAYELRVPAGMEAAAGTHLASLPTWKRPSPHYVTHRVRSGETLSGIARRYGTSVSTIMRANGLRSANRIMPGQRLRIPARGARLAGDDAAARAGSRANGQ